MVHNFNLKVKTTSILNMTKDDHDSLALLAPASPELAQLSPSLFLDFYYKIGLSKLCAKFVNSNLPMPKI